MDDEQNNNNHEQEKKQDEKKPGDKNRAVFMATTAVVLIILIAFLVLSYSGVFVAKEPPKDPTQYELDSVTYVFSGNIAEAWKFNATDMETMRDVVRSADRIYIVFNGSSEEDNAYISVASFNLVSKLQNYFAYSQARMAKFGTVNLNNISANAALDPNATYIKMIGPKTGAEKNLLYNSNTLVVDNTSFRPWIYLEAMDYSNFTKGADKLALIVLGYEE